MSWFMYNNPAQLLEDIQYCIEKVLAYTHGMTYDSFANDDKTIDAVIRNFEIIGEVATKLPDNFKETNMEVDWFQIRGMRNRIVHDYRNVNLIIIWETIENDLPPLKIKISNILKRL